MYVDELLRELRSQDYFFNYTDFVVNYDEGQYIPIFLIQLIYKVSFFNNMLYKLHIFSKVNTN